MPTYPDQVRAAERAARRKRRGLKPSVAMASLRVAELTRIIIDRYGDVLPDDDAGRDDAEIVLHHLARRTTRPAERMAEWLEERAPWMTQHERDSLTERVIATPIRWKADTLAARLNLTAADRQRLAIRTIGAIDQTAEQRAEQRAQRKADQKRQRRASRGAKPRTSLDAPWTAAGISRRTWFRRRSRGTQRTQ